MSIMAWPGSALMPLGLWHLLSTGPYLVRTMQYFSIIHTIMRNVITLFHAAHEDLMNNDTLNRLAADAEGCSENDCAHFSLEHFSYKNHVIEKLMLEHFSETNFTGATVRQLCILFFSVLYSTYTTAPISILINSTSTSSYNYYTGTGFIH